MRHLLTSPHISTHPPPFSHLLTPAIAAFPSARFYGGRLLSAPATLAASSPAGNPASWLGPWVFVNVGGGGEERAPDGSVRNRAEAAAVLSAIRALRSLGVAIGRTSALRVLTFYAAQVACIRAALEADGVRDGVSVGTVDGAQGAESEVVILSFVRSNARAAIGFVEEWRRLNVAITRAQRALIMIGCARTVGSGEAGEAASDLVRAAAKASAVFEYVQGDVGDPQLAPALAAELVDVAAAKDAASAAKKRRAAPPPVADSIKVTDASVPPPVVGVTASSGSATERVMPPRRVAPTDDENAAPDDEDAYLQARAAEIEAFVSECRRVDKERADKRAMEERAAKAVFAPPPVYSYE